MAWMENAKGKPEKFDETGLDRNIACKNSCLNNHEDYEYTIRTLWVTIFS